MPDKWQKFLALARFFSPTTLKWSTSTAYEKRTNPLN